MMLFSLLIKPFLENFLVKFLVSLNFAMISVFFMHLFLEHGLFVLFAFCPAFLLFSLHSFAFSLRLLQLLLVLFRHVAVKVVKLGLMSFQLALFVLKVLLLLQSLSFLHVVHHPRGVLILHKLLIFLDFLWF